MPPSPHLKALRERLQHRLDALTSEIGNKRHEVSENPPPLHGTGDIGDVSMADASRDLDFSEAERDADEMRLIQAVLRRIDQDHYGECVDCGIAIAPERLAVQPLALRCVECQRAIEHTAALRSPSL